MNFDYKFHPTLDAFMHQTFQVLSLQSVVLSIRVASVENAPYCGFQYRIFSNLFYIKPFFVQVV